MLDKHPNKKRLDLIMLENQNTRPRTSRKSKYSSKDIRQITRNNGEYIVEDATKHEDEEDEMTRMMNDWLQIHHLVSPPSC